MKLFLDSSYVIYLRYAKIDEVAEYTNALLKKAVESGSRLLVNMIVIDETIWILTKKYEIVLDEVFELIDHLFPLLDVVPLDYSDYHVMKEVMVDRGLKPSDALHVASMSKIGSDYIVSEDREFDKVPWIKRVWLDTPYKAPLK